MEALGTHEGGWIATGSREWWHEMVILRVLGEISPRFVVHGNCRDGADAIVEKWCEVKAIPTVKVPARWKDKNGVLRREAGPLRNFFMLSLFPGLPVMAFPEGIAKGTKDCIKSAVQRGHPVRVYDAKGNFKRL
jgi:hypothetical protein